MSTAREAAEQAVARGIAWLDKNVPQWREKIDVETLDQHYPCYCVLGQIDGDFYKFVWDRKLGRADLRRLGFTSSTGIRYCELTRAWRRALKGTT